MDTESDMYKTSGAHYMETCYRTGVNWVEVTNHVCTAVKAKTAGSFSQTVYKFCFMMQTALYCILETEKSFFSEQKEPVHTLQLYWRLPGPKLLPGNTHCITVKILLCRRQAPCQTVVSMFCDQYLKGKYNYCIKLSQWIFLFKFNLSYLSQCST